jgi:hypothetical protein
VRRLGDKRTACYVTTRHRLTLPFSPANILTKKNMTVVPSTLLSSVSPIEDKSDTTEVIEAESQAVLYTLTEHDFQEAFKKWQ